MQAEEIQATAEWLARQITKAFPWATAPSYLIHDNDGAYGYVFTGLVKAMGIRDVLGNLRHHYVRI